MSAFDWSWLRFGFDGFAWPWLLLALPLPWLVRSLLPPQRAAGAALRVPFFARLGAIGSARGPARAGGGRALWLGAAAWALLCVAAARPQQAGELVQPPQAGRDLMLAVDLSGSMAEEDMLLGGRVVDRLTAAKAVIADFLDRRAGDRVGLLVFGRRAYALAPLTLDRDSVREQLLDSVVGLAGRETAIGDAIGLAVKRLRAQHGAGGDAPRVLILLTDGVNTAGLLEPLKAAELARDAGVRIHTVAFGGEGGGLSMFGFRMQAPGGEEIDEDTLRRISALTGGRMFRARDTGELAGIYAEIDQLEPVERPAQALRPRVERYHWPLGLALLLGFDALLLAGRPRRARTMRAPA
ncbi:VWA domain-containing protein [Luteimonas sp. RD2P54]|uniref:VWA domain-containing protein n=1 Tax=Luteimonas endophytica TaxID=3042023 RepID=A0ABT6J811_9GAMM|nr:VWA domain-containing protein [Luteimonas endophytica]MDH5822889.1 VWA domain-containing protein [Luteimonas endophytica]